MVVKGKIEGLKVAVEAVVGRTKAVSGMTVARLWQ